MHGRHSKTLHRDIPWTAMIGASLMLAALALAWGYACVRLQS